MHDLRESACGPEGSRSGSLRATSRLPQIMQAPSRSPKASSRLPQAMQAPSRSLKASSRLPQVTQAPSRLGNVPLVPSKCLASVCKCLASVCKCLASVCKCLASVCKCLISLSQVSLQCLANVSRKCVSRKLLASVSQAYCCVHVPALYAPIYPGRKTQANLPTPPPLKHLRANTPESPPEKAIYYALRTRIIYPAPKARGRGLSTTHYISVLYIKR